MNMILLSFILILYYFELNLREGDTNNFTFYRFCDRYVKQIHVESNAITGERRTDERTKTDVTKKK